MPKEIQIKPFLKYVSKNRNIFTAVFVVLGFVFLALTAASTNVFHTEAESGARTGNVSVINDSNASSGQAIRFGPDQISSSQYRGEYFSNNSLSGSPTLIRGDNEINFNWGYDSPDSSIPVDDFSVRWTRDISFDAATYRFTVTVDDGARLYVNNQLILEKWFQQAATTYTVDHTMASGSHTIKLEYNELVKDAVIQMSFEKVSSDSTPPTTACSGTYGAGSGATTRGPTTYNSSGTTTVKNVIFDGSHSDDLVRVYNGKVIFENVTFRGNGTGTSGHTLEIKQGGSAEVRNSVFEGSPSEDTIQTEGNGTTLVECNKIGGSAGEDHVDTKSGGAVTIKNNDFITSARNQTIQNHNGSNPVHLIGNSGMQRVFYESGQTGGTIVGNDISGYVWLYDVSRILVEANTINTVKHGDSGSRHPSSTYFKDNNISNFNYNGGTCYRSGSNGASLSQCTSGAPSWY